MHGGMPGKALQPLTHVNQVVNLFLLLIHFAKIRIQLQCPVQGDIQLIGNHLGDGIHVGIGQIHDTSHIPDDTLCRQRTESDNLHHLVRTIFSAYIIDDLLTSFETEVNINIRHGYTLRV